MRGLVAACLLTAAACSGPEPPWAAEPALSLDLRCSISADQVALLQPVVVTLDLYRKPEIEVEFAPTVDENEFLCETSVLPEVPLGSGFWQRTVLVLEPVRGPGELAIPSFVAKAKDDPRTASTPEHKLVVTSTLLGHGETLEAPAAPFPARAGLGTWGLLAAGCALVLALAWYFTRRRKLRASPAECALPPHIVALRALSRLRSAPRGTTAEVEAFYVEVSLVLRVYLEARFSLRAPEQTTEEFLRALETGCALAREHRAELQQFLQQCDLVKFAAHRPAEGDHLATFAIAEAFVERTRADRVSAADGREAAAEAAGP